MITIDFTMYQSRSAQYDRRPGDLEYHVLGMAEELGEISRFLVRAKRDNTPIDLLQIKDELGDLLWNLSQTVTDLDLTLEDIAMSNVAKIGQKWAGGGNE